MGLFSSRMTADQLAKAKRRGQTTTELNDLAVVANGFGVTRAALSRTTR